MLLKNVRESHLHILYERKRSGETIKEIQVVRASRILCHSIQWFSFINNEESQRWSSLFLETELFMFTKGKPGRRGPWHCHFPLRFQCSTLTLGSGPGRHLIMAQRYLSLVSLYCSLRHWWKSLCSHSDSFFCLYWWFYEIFGLFDCSGSGIIK